MTVIKLLFRILDIEKLDRFIDCRNEIISRKYY